MEWIKSVLCFMIVSSIILELVPEESYKAGVRFVVGLILVVMVLYPVTVKIMREDKPDLAGLFDFTMPATDNDYEEIFNSRYEELIEDESDE